jgi:hypothetical protein
VNGRACALSGAPPGEGLDALTQRPAGGIDFGDLDLPAVPPELDAMLAAMLQQEQQQQRSGSTGALAQQAGSGLGGTAAGDMPGAAAARMPSNSAAAAAAVDPPGALDRFVGGSTAAEAEDTVDAQLSHEQLHQELTEASAGLQGLWLNPDPVRALSQSPTSLGFSAHLSQGLVLGPGGALSPVSARLAMGPPAAGHQGLALGPGGALSPVSARLAMGPPAAGQDTLGPVGSVGAAAGNGDGAQPGSTQYMAAAAAAAGMLPWSTWHEEQQQWLDDIFSSGPTLPHEP